MSRSSDSRDVGLRCAHPTYGAIRFPPFLRKNVTLYWIRGGNLALSQSTGLLAHYRERSYSCAMSMMVTELYDALIAAGAPEEKARAAAQAMSEESLATKADITRLERELLVVKWMTGAIVAGVVSLLLKAFAG